jgi:hypothetical protein
MHIRMQGNADVISNPDYRRSMGVSGPPPTPPIQPPTQPATAPPRDQPMPKWLKRLIWNVCAIAAIVIAFGFMHCIPSAVKMCWKESWGLSDTFVDPEDFVGKSRLEMMDRMKTIRALQECGVLTFSKRGDE